MIEMNNDEIERLLEGARIGRLAMADLIGRPYVIPLPFCFANGTIYLRLPLKGRKGEVLNQNPRVCFEVDYYSDNFNDYGSVLIEGELEPVQNIQEKLEIKQKNHDKYDRLRSGFRPGHGRTTPVEDLPMKKIRVRQITGRRRDDSADFPAKNDAPAAEASATK